METNARPRERAGSHSSALTPVAPDERVVLIDALRGFALLGVFLGNLVPWLSGYMFLSPRERARLPSARFDEAARDFVRYAVNDRFITVLAFLFGLGIALQAGRAESAAAPFARHAVKRQLALLAIGLLHLLGLWYGDILTVYALTGLALLPLARLRTRTVLIVGLFLAAGWSTVLAARPWLSVMLGAPAPGDGPPAGFARMLEVSRGVRAAATRGGFADVVVAHCRFLTEVFYTPDRLLGLPTILGRFLLGYAAGRAALLHDPSRHRGVLRAMLGGGFVLGALGIVLAVVRRGLDRAGQLPSHSGRAVLFNLGVDVGILAQAAFYVGVFAWVSQRGRAGRRVMELLAPAGRMALTVYLSQTVVSLALFYGYGAGLFGTMGPARTVPLAIALFAVQVGACHAWLARYRMGPMEWAWRSLSYGARMGMRRGRETVRAREGASEGVTRRAA